MEKIKNLLELKPGQKVIHFEYGWPSEFTFLMMCPGNIDVAYLQDFWGNPVTLHRVELEEMDAEWYIQFTDLQVYKYRMQYYEEMATKYRNLYQRLFDNINP